MEYRDILYETDERLAFITLNRPEKLNALSNNLRAEIMDAMREAEHDPEVGVIILKAAGRSFSAGYDLSPSRTAKDDEYVDPRSKMPPTGTTHPGRDQWARHVVMTNWTIWELAKPVIAQIQGYCLAGGTELATICDFRIVAEDANIGYPPVRAMTTMDMVWSPWHLPPAIAREFAFVGDNISGTKMAQYGWANYAVPIEDLDEFTIKFARRMGYIDNEMLMFTKRAVNRQYEAMGIREGLAAGTEIQALSARRDAASEWGRRVRDDGLKSALEWRDGPFRDFRGVYDSAPKERAVAGMDKSGKKDS
ncbi:MAG TPA: enoyl-CoA hydratase-related protein [Pseudomonadales bacterium]|jgi:enoyl-CoA hydratase|nr:enoyl-CoA hydratase [Gammaproteobacteria bacterium]MDP6027904.1 enoyl-CoA hydratase-related protein [Pseudomonadales bacterium]MDP6316137.1 enoyl-CoA hydratase-related protein [Pseudomonadales bacterium]MDP7315607.1 enoyl-CoA hydratase-related protein [Pseudomonadales bacterium]HJP52870.1 enoyl-CoA hydratase-related protein [Pseudomonadales bacterium]|tara:strand:+ start:14736 stop:15656 length:921 start_codon:yes stop_codon:yes gene_type:complete